MDLKSAATHCFQTLYQRDQTLLAVTMFAPRAVRAQLQALGCLYHELVDIPNRTSEPLMAEIRREWWRERLAEDGSGGMDDSPLLQCLKGAETQGLAIIAETSLDVFLAQITALIPKKHKGFHRVVRAYKLDQKTSLWRLVYAALFTS